MIKLYILLGAIILYILFVIYCKVFYRFWSTQPVFHLHNLYYWFFPPGIIQHSLPPLTKFYDDDVKFYFWSAISDDTKDQFYRLNKNFYLQNKTISYKPTTESIYSYFEHHNDPCFIALLFKDDPLFHYSKKNIIPRQTCIASLTSRPLSIFLHGNMLKVNYVDYLCIHKKHRKKGIAPKMIYSYYYHARRNNDIVAHLFKREGVGTFITPMTVYNTFGFTLKIPKINPNTMTPLLINVSNFQLFYHYLQIIKNDYPCFVRPAFSNIKHLIEKKLLYIFLLMDRDKSIGCYVFRNPLTYYEDKGASIDLIASHCSDNKNIDYFKDAFYNCLPQIDYKYEYLILENISKNHHIIKDIRQSRKYIFKSHTSYYLYNFGYRPFISKDVFLLS
jgi:GNAT superfamily N-acetyltransferase